MNAAASYSVRALLHCKSYCSTALIDYSLSLSPSHKASIFLIAHQIFYFFNLPFNSTYNKPRPVMNYLGGFVIMQ